MSDRANAHIFYFIIIKNLDKFDFTQLQNPNLIAFDLIIFDKNSIRKHLQDDPEIKKLYKYNESDDKFEKIEK